MLHTIIVGCDLSAPSDAAIERAIGIALPHHATIVLVHVHATGVDVPISEIGNAMAARLGEASEAVRAGEVAKLQARHAGLAALGLTIEVVVRSGPAGEVLGQVAAERSADLIVVGTHGATGITRFLLGSVAAETVRHAPCDVLVCRGPVTRGAFGRPLVAMDFSAAASRALAHAVELATPEATIEVVHAWQLPAGSWGTNLLGLQSRFPWSTVRDAVLESAKQQAATLVGTHVALARPFHVELVQGPPASTVTGVAERGGHDLIIVGTHGHRGFRRLLLGSVADGVIRHAPCSVLVVHGEHAGETAQFQRVT